eukprot:SAG25_NODE_794_length_5286_cov_3.737420_2_plen_66_part_00
MLTAISKEVFKKVAETSDLRFRSRVGRLDFRSSDFVRDALRTAVGALAGMCSTHWPAAPLAAYCY